MKSAAYRFSLVVTGWSLIVGCAKDDTAPTGSASAYIAAQVDSAFIQAPNVVTPNADGINDVFIVQTRHMNSLNTTVKRLNGETVFSSNSLQPLWNDLDSTDLGRYIVTVLGVSHSGHQLSGRAYLDLLTYHGASCIPYHREPVTPDQFDPLIFGVSYSSNDIFCE